MKLVRPNAYKSQFLNPMNESIYNCMTKIKLQITLIQYMFSAWRHQLQQARVNPSVNIEFRCPL